MTVTAVTMIRARWTERPESDEVLKSHVDLGRSTSKAKEGFDEKMLNIISRQGNLQI